MPVNVDKTKPRSKLRILYLLKILYLETDETHGLTSTQLIASLQNEGLSIERKTFYDDIAALRDFGIDVHATQRTHREYALHDHNIWS